MADHDNVNIATRDGQRARIIDLESLREKRHEELLAEARALMIDARDEEALTACKEALRYLPDSEPALLLASTLAAVRGRLAEGLRFALDIVQMEPEEADGYYEVAMCLMDLGYPEEALAWLEMGDRHTQEREDDLLDFYSAANAEALALLCRYEEAMQTLEQARVARGDDQGILEDTEARVMMLRRRPDC